MSCWKVAGKGWRYQFKQEKKRYSGGFYPTKAAGRAAEAEHKKRLQKEKETHTDTDCEVPSFRDIANEYLDYSQRRFSEKNYKGKVYIFKEFLSFTGGIPFSNIDARLLERYLATLPCNSNHNRHRKALCALFAWAFKRGLLAILVSMSITCLTRSLKGASPPKRKWPKFSWPPANFAPSSWLCSAWRPGWGKSII